METSEDISATFVGARLSAEYVLNTHENGSPFVSVYAGAGADLITEDDGNIALPQVEVALRFRFGGGDKEYVILSEAKNLNDSVDSSAQEQPQNDKVVIAENTSEDTDSSQASAVTDTGTRPTASPQNDKSCYLPILTSQPPPQSAVVYFSAETADPIGDHKQALDSIGATLANDTSTRALIRGYAAPVGSQQARAELSQKRAQFAQDYLTNNFGINSDRLIVRALSDCKPDTIDDQDPPLDKRRITKIIILKTEKE
ncbi:hypothetical protein FACS189487_00010 [Campylobacterota bacterium]|nr:hypothetical protein FACS189487_00010 [Campylobacterota bacterium]